MVTLASSKEAALWNIDMTMFKPNLAVSELAIFRGGKSVFRERFHHGLNIIRGQNSSGKSTIMDFLFYVLGGDIPENQWRETAVLCDWVLAEVQVNGLAITLAREIAPKSQRPMRIYQGPLSEAMASAAEGWKVYPYARSSVDSFSQVLFRYLNLPEVQYGDSNTKITMNQILRILYSDQLSSVDKIFKDQRFDDAITRQTVGDLLSGAYSNRYYLARLRKRELEDLIRDNESRIKTLIRTHGRDGHPLTVEWLTGERRALEGSIEKLNTQISQLEESIFRTEASDRLTLNDQEETYRQVVSLQEGIGNARKRLDQLEMQKADSAEFISSLDKRIEELHQSQEVLSAFDLLKFECCPSCLAPVKDHAVDGACSLCKSAYDHERVKRRALGLINEYSRQKDRSSDLLKKRDAELEQTRLELGELTGLWRQASERYMVALRTPTTELRAELRKLNREAGYAYRQLEELALKEAIVGELSELTALRQKLSDEQTGNNLIITSEEQKTQRQRIHAKNKIEEQVLFFLKNDLERQSTFVSADTISFEFDADRLAVNGESFFSASSMVYLRNSFLAGFLYAAANDPSFSHPRLLIMDTVEDKGLEPERSRNFQKLLYAKSKTAVSTHQVIIATSMIAPELDIPELTVGEFYTHDNRTLKLLT